MLTLILLVVFLSLPPAFAISRGIVRVLAVSPMNVYEIVTDKIIKQLESGVAPWRKPWRTELPVNLISQKAYRGLNVFLLGRKATVRGIG